MVADRYFHTGTRVVTWQDPGGYDAYRPPAGAIAAAREPDNFGVRHSVAVAPAAVGVPLSGLPELRRLVDQFVLHYDDCGSSKWCFIALQRRQLSVHFLLDVDGTVYQTLDLRERAYHATTANNRSIGIEIANLGAFEPREAGVLAQWYHRDATGHIRLAPPPELGDPGTRTKDFVGRPARAQPVPGIINGHRVAQYDFTPEQYAALIKLTAALHQIFPRLKLDCPRDIRGRVLPGKLPDATLDRFRGILGHWHIQA
ncbi:MAG: N-acetylmuramoyl-L-alanine amidase, partial [Opitutales bacterium]